MLFATPNLTGCLLTHPNLYYSRDLFAEYLFLKHVGFKASIISDFDLGIVVGARQTGLSVSETANLLGHTTVCRLVGGNGLLMRNIRGERLDWFELTGRLQLMK